MKLYAKLAHKSSGSSPLTTCGAQPGHGLVARLSAGRAAVLPEDAIDSLGSSGVGGQRAWCGDGLGDAGQQGCSRTRVRARGLGLEIWDKCPHRCRVQPAAVSSVSCTARFSTELEGSR